MSREYIRRKIKLANTFTFLFVCMHMDTRTGIPSVLQRLSTTVGIDTALYTAEKIARNNDCRITKIIFHSLELCSGEQNNNANLQRRTTLTSTSINNLAPRPTWPPSRHANYHSFRSNSRLIGKKPLEAIENRG